MAAKSPLIYERKSSGADRVAGAFDGHVSRILWVVAGVLLLGTAVDLGILWFVQRQAGPQWEFVAIVNTLEAITRPALALALMFLALHVAGSRSIAAYRVLGAGALILGLAAGAVGGLLVTDYFVLSRTMPDGAAATAFKSTAWKGMALSGVGFLLLVPTGILGLRGPRKG